MLNRDAKHFRHQSHLEKVSGVACSFVRGKTLFQATDKSVKFSSGKFTALVA